MIPLYRSDPYQETCETIVDRVVQGQSGYQVVFCREALFLEGGGQPMDYGFVCSGAEDFAIQRIVKEKGNIGYEVAVNATFEKGMAVTCKLDIERRLRIMRLHTAQHALAGSLRLVRASLLTGGMQIDSSASKCSVIYPNESALLEGELDQGLTILKGCISEAKATRSETVESEAEAIQKYASLYRPTVASGSLKGRIRLIVIDDLDANACGGTHVRTLREVVGIKIVSLNATTEGSSIHFELQD